MGVCETPSSFCFNCCKVDNAFFEVRSVRRSHSIGTLLVRMKPPITLVERVFLWGQMVGMIFSFFGKILRLDYFQSFDNGILDFV